MALPQQQAPRRRPQILYDQTGGTSRFDASEYQDTWIEDARVENAWANEDNWVTRFMARLAGLIRSMGGPK